MQASDVWFYWLIFGVTLILLEAVVPGLVVIFLGLAACLVSWFIYTGFIEGWMQILTTWFVSSLTLIIFLRGLIRKLMPGEEEVDDVDEDQDALGTIVEVIELITPDSTQGRIRFRGTSWPAVSKTTKIRPGEQARLVERRDLVWYVVPVAIKKGSGL